MKKELTFGTGGIRAEMGPEPWQLNKATIRRNTEGYARYLEQIDGKAVVIAYDNRRHSEKFAEETAAVLTSHGLHVYLFDALRPTPELSFAVRYLKADGGIVITASHNPPKYNGYKIYDKEGCQCVPRDTDRIIRCIQGVEEIEVNCAKEAEGICERIGEKVDEAYYRAIETVQERPELEKMIRIVYTPLHGTGNVPVTTMLRRFGYDLFVVEEQSMPDPDFRNASSPNPEDEVAFDRAILLGEEVNADLLIATDPDCDRIGLMVRHEGTYRFLSGNQTGAILLWYLLSTKEEKETLPINGVVFDTIVTSDLGKRIAAHFGIETESTLTGFKYIGDKIREYAGEKTFLFGYEESCGYLIKDFARDKDGVQAAVFAAEAANFYYGKGKTLIDVLQELYGMFGEYKDELRCEIFEGEDGAERMKELVNKYRDGETTEVDGRRVIAKEDYLTSLRTECDGTMVKLTLPKSNVVKLFLEDGSWVVVRPSGNEPKIKYYKNLRIKG